MALLSVEPEPIPHDPAIIGMYLSCWKWWLGQSAGISWWRKLKVGRWAQQAQPSRAQT
jgi:hypothetical protein